MNENLSLKSERGLVNRAICVALGTIMLAGSMTSCTPEEIKMLQDNIELEASQADQPSPSLEDALVEVGVISNEEVTAARFIIDKESKSCHTRINGYYGQCKPEAPAGLDTTNKAYGICQAKPARKMASAGSDWKTNIVTQLKWCDEYAKGRYGGWIKAAKAWKKKKWW